FPPSCLPQYASHGNFTPMYSSQSSGAISVPPLNERGPRQNKPPYPALGRPCVVGEPNDMTSVLTFRSAERNDSTQYPSARLISITSKLRVSSNQPVFSSGFQTIDSSSENSSPSMCIRSKRVCSIRP